MTGETAIPHAWKHMFCHTSVQTVCHYLTAILIVPWKPNINTLSGLFVKRCRCCGLKLQLGPLHAIVVVALNLANSALPGENLFGMLALLVCLLTFRADVCLVVEVCIPAILGSRQDAGTCQHRSINAAELASAVSDEFVRKWAPEVQLGWMAIVELLNYRIRWGQAQEAMASMAEDSSSTSSHESHGDGDLKECCLHPIHDNDYYDEAVSCGDERLGTIWAAIQVELVTYRRLELSDPWLSLLFKMQDLIEGLHSDDDGVIGHLVDNFGEGGVQPFSRCGFFLSTNDPGCARREEACALHFANLEDWKRTTFIQPRGVEYE